MSLDFQWDFEQLSVSTSFHLSLIGHSLVSPSNSHHFATIIATVFLFQRLDQMLFWLRVYGRCIGSCTIIFTICDQSARMTQFQYEEEHIDPYHFQKVYLFWLCRISADIILFTPMAYPPFFLLQVMTRVAISLFRSSFTIAQRALSYQPP